MSQAWHLDDPDIDPYVLRVANFAHDQALARAGIDPAVHIRSGWTGKMGTTGPLTDKKIAKYQALGYYSEEFREARRKLASIRKAKRQGNFTQIGDRLIYSPL
jgi:hypothetical protein